MYRPTARTDRFSKMPPPSKKRKTTATEEISFDPSAREEYLTGFHKRKLARIKHAQEENAKKEREEKIRARAEIRKERKEDLERHVSEVNRLVKQANGDIFEDDENEDDDAASGAEDNKPAEPEFIPINQEDEYIDEDKYTTVTIESVGISKHGFERAGGGEGSEDEVDADGVKKEKKVWTKEKPKTARPKKKKIKFRYETKAERKAERVKQGVKKKKMREARAPKE
jgi:ribosomal RNA-processing protein 17